MTPKKKEIKSYDFNPETIAELAKHCASEGSFMEAFQALKKRVIEQALEGELKHHLGYEKHARHEGENVRNGYTDKSLITENGLLEIQTPRDRAGNFEPQLVQKRQRHFKGMDDKIIAMYARGMSIRDIQAHVEEIYGVEMSHDLISTITDQVLDEVTAWQNRPLDAIYPILYLDCLMVKIREGNQILNKAVYLAIGVTMQGHKEILGLWISKAEGAKFWLQVISEIKNRGVSDIYIACVDGLKGFTQAINSVFPNTTVQLCVVHMVRNSLNYVPWKDRKNVATDLKEIYTAKSLTDAESALENFKNKWDQKYPIISDIWQRNWQGITPFLAFPQDIRKAIYTTNAIEAINRQIRKIIKSKGCFPNDTSVFKILFLTLHNAQKKWTMPIRDWKSALNQFSILFNSYTL